MLNLKKRLSACFGNRPDSELGQALTRVAIVTGFFFYFTNPEITDLHYPKTGSAVWFAIWGYMLWSIALASAVLMSKTPSPPRRYLGMVGDTFITTFLMFAAGEAGAALIFVYLWITIGNGFRYGIPYLTVCGTLSVVGFVFVIASTSFWNQHTGIAIGMLLMLVLIPLYTGFLLSKLHKAIKQAHEASFAKSSFLATMSHELRTPLNGVIGLTDLLQETSLDKSQKELMDAVQASAKTLHSLIENVLDISRIEAGKLEIIEEDYDLYRLLRSLVAMLEPQAIRKGLKLGLHIKPRTPYMLYGDPKRLHQVLLNLVGNAIKFTENGRIDVHVHPFESVDSSAKWLRFEVIDTGIGISPEKQANIFEPFVQADTSITRRYGGTGLGTNISRQLVKMMGGKIGLSSKPAEGTAFWFEIPISPSKTQPADEFSHHLNVGMVVGPDLGFRLTELIQGWGGKAISVILSPTGNAKGDLIDSLSSSAGTYDAIVAERSLLGEDPANFATLLKCDAAFRNLPIILIDPASSEHHVRAWMEAGFSAVLKNPVNPTLLFNALHQAASQKALPENVVPLAEHFRSRAGNIKLCVLVAEDNPINQKVIRGLLGQAGHEVIMANNGEEALDLLEANIDHVSLAILDMHMPDLSGAETVKRWRFMERGLSDGSYLPVIILTADARGEAEKQCRDAGADDFLTKPVNSRLLLDKVAEWAAAKDSQPAKTTAAGSGSRKPPLPPKVLDESLLKSLAEFGGGMSFVRDLIEEFAQDSARILGETRKAVTDKNYGAWKDRLHMLKGSASDIGALAMAQACANAERIRAFEIEQPVANEHLSNVENARLAALAAIEGFLAATDEPATEEV